MTGAGARFGRLRRGLARGGLEYVVTAGCSYLPPWLATYRHHVLVWCTTVPPVRRRPAGVVVRRATPDDAPRLVGLGDVTAEEVGRYLARGDLCIVAEEGGVILAATWAATGTLYVVRLCLDLAIPDDAFYVHDTWTKPDARRRGLAGLCYRRLFDELAAEGRKTAYAAIEVLNEASRRAHARWGFRQVGRTLTFDVGSLRTTWTPRWHDRTRRLTIRWMRDATPSAPSPLAPPPAAVAGT